VSLVPEQVSLVSTNYDPTFVWCQPTIAHINWDSAPVIRHVARWVAAVKKDQADHKTAPFWHSSGCPSPLRVHHVLARAPA
jgi:hypothetical protein